MGTCICAVCTVGILPIGWCQGGAADSAGASKLETIPSSSTADSGNELPRSAPRIMHTCALSAWGYTCPTCTILATMALNSGLLVCPASVTRPRRLPKLEVPNKVTANQRADNHQRVELGTTARLEAPPTQNVQKF